MGIFDFVKEAGKKLLLVTNSEWEYARHMMTYAFDRFLPEGTTWRDLFDVVICSARKPAFFGSGNPLYEIVDEEQGFLHPVIGGLRKKGIFHGGSAAAVEEQNATTVEISSTLVKVRDAASEASDATHTAAEASQEMSQLARELQQQVDRFQI